MYIGGGKSPEYRRAEAKLAAILFVALFSWFLTYLMALRPMIDAALIGHVPSQPTKLHLIPIIAPIVILGLILARRLPPR